MTDVAVITDLTHVFADGKVALDAVSTTVTAGVITGVVGPDGAGKTTLLRLMAGLLRPTRGGVTVLGHDMAHEAQSVHADIGYMPQRFGLYEDLTVAENLSLHADLHRLSAAVRQDRFGGLLRFTRLGPFADRLSGHLSGGMKQKLGLACALLARPRLLLLDEPSVGVDPASRRDLWHIVTEMMAESGDGHDAMAVVWATAYLDEAERCGRVLLLHDGKVLSDAPPATFLAPLKGRVFRLSVPPERRRAISRRAGAHPAVIDAAVEGDTLRIVLKPDAAVPAPAELGGTSLIATAPRFEDGFIERIARSVALPQADPARPPHDGPPQIEVRELTRRFGSFVAVDRVSFSVSHGEIFGLLGPNGAGKSTIFRMLCGLLRPSSGSALVAGQDLLRAAAAARGRIGYMAQRFSLYGHLSVEANLAFFARVYGLTRSARLQAVAEALDRFDLRDHADDRAGDLPLGVKQRLALAASLLHGPDILFLDEPTSGVDPLTRRSFWSRIGMLAESGVTVLVTSHFMDEAEYCDRLAIVTAGRMIAIDTPAALRARVRTPSLPEPTLEDAFITLVEQERTEARAA